jgi:hypothetical protein
MREKYYFLLFFIFKFERGRKREKEKGDGIEKGEERGRANLAWHAVVVALHIAQLVV